PEAQAAFVAEIDSKMRGTVWTSGGCRSWYLDATGRNSTIWPGFTWSFKRRIERFDPAEYNVGDRPRALGHEWPLEMGEKGIIVAIDGPAGAGKSTIARRLAERIGLAFVDTGAIYRTVALVAMEKGIDEDEKIGALTE